MVYIETRSIIVLMFLYSQKVVLFVIVLIERDVNNYMKYLFREVI